MGCYLNIDPKDTRRTRGEFRQGLLDAGAVQHPECDDTLIMDDGLIILSKGSDDTHFFVRLSWGASAQNIENLLAFAERANARVSRQVSLSSETITDFAEYLGRGAAVVGGILGIIPTERDPE